MFNPVKNINYIGIISDSIKLRFLDTAFPFNLHKLKAYQIRGDGFFGLGSTDYSLNSSRIFS